MNVPISLFNGKSIELNNIVESGDNYIRFSDGTQICYGQLSVPNTTYSSNGYYHRRTAYPKTFDALKTTVVANINYVQPTSLSNIVKANFSIMACGSASSRDIWVEVYNGNSESVTASVYVNYIAIGRWK